MREVFCWFGLVWFGIESERTKMEERILVRRKRSKSG